VPAAPVNYREDPAAYCLNVLGIHLTPMQEELFRLVRTPPYRLLVSCGHGVGKSYFGAAFISWFFDNFAPSATLATAPTHKHVKNILWRHVRTQRLAAGLGGFVGNVVPELRGELPDHYAEGLATESGEGFSGRHQQYMAFLFDEATDINPVFWDATHSMFHSRPGHHWICFFNPLNTSCQAYKEWKDGDWHKIGMGCLDHPNVLAGLEEKDEPFPGAVSVHQINSWTKSHCEPITSVEAEADAASILWPPQGYGTLSTPSVWYRPDAYMESRCLGRWPSGDVFGVWSLHAWKCALRGIEWKPGLSVYPEIGCDPAGKGDDYAAIHARWGPCSIHHERHNGWTHKQLASRLKMLCLDMATRSNAIRPHDARQIEPEEIVVKIDADGLGGYLIDERGDFNFVPVCGSGQPLRSEIYHNKRAELWFLAAQLAKDGRMSLAALPKDLLNKIEHQMLAPRWMTQAQSGKVILEDKEDIRDRIGCSPDDADAIILAYTGHGSIASIAWEVASQAEAVVDTKKKWEPPTSTNPFKDVPSPFAEEADDFGEEVKTRLWQFGSQ